jgi:hypothetical protein
MKNIEKWLQENGIEYSRAVYGSNYFNDGFRVIGLKIAFYFDEIGNTRDQEKQLIKFISRKKAYICDSFYFGAGRSYRIMTKFDDARLKKHEKAVSDAVNTFWKTEHAQRM